MSKRWDVLGLGVVSVDELVYVDRYPPYGSKVSVVQRSRQGGGLTGTALVAAARMGARAAFCGVLGDDELSRFTLREFDREGVDCSSVLFRAEARPTQSVVIIELSTAQRTIFFSRAGVTERQPEEITDELISGCRVLFVDHTVVRGALRAVELAQRYGITVISDIEDERGPGVLDLLGQVDHLVSSSEFARRLTGEDEPEAMVRALGGPGRACCVVTAGEEGCWFSERGAAVVHCPAFKVQVVDTTGCGDTFHGAYAACIAQGASVATAIRVASATAALKATQPGGRAGIPSRAQVDRFLAEVAPANGIDTCSGAML